MTRLVLVLAAAGIASTAPFFTLSATYVPPVQPGAPGAVAVTFSPRDPEVKLNQDPAPRLKLDPGQQVLVDRQPPPASTVKTFDPDTARYLDPAFPVRFSVAPAPDAPKGRHAVAATVTFFFCSSREGWCRKGTEPIEVSVNVP